MDAAASIDTGDASAVDGTAAGIASGAGAGALWGLVFLAPELVRPFTPVQLAAGRYLAYGLLAAALAAGRLPSLLRTVRGRDWLSLVWLSATGNLLYYVLLSTAVREAGIASTSLVIGFLPVAVTIVGSRDAGAPTLRRLAPSLVLCVAGALCIGWQAAGGPGSGGGLRRLVGIACALGALVSWTLYAVGNARCLARLEDVSVGDWNLLAGIVTGGLALLLSPFGLLGAPIVRSAASWAWFGGVCVGVAVAASILGNALWNRASRLLPLTMVGQMILFETLFALVYGFLWEERLPRLPELAAFGFLAASVVACVSVHRRGKGGRPRSAFETAERPA